jgi:hypothetical protein
MPDIAQQDMSYQPATKAYSLSANKAVPPSAPQPKPEHEQKPKMPRKPINWKSFLLLLGVIASLTLIFLIFLEVLNYFRIISLSGFIPNQLINLPQISQPPALTYDSKLGLWTANGTFYGYNQHAIQIKINNRITNFQWSDDNSKAAFFNSEKNLNNQNYTPIIYTLFDLEQNQNLGKKVTVQYEIKNGENVINILNLFKL